jgi:hypothetical protein
LYTSLSDEGLRTVKREELTDLARGCYDAELAQRGLKPEGSTGVEAPDSASVANGEELVAAATCMNPEEAELARELLESAGIPSYPENIRARATSFIGTDGMCGRSVFVPKSRLDEAREILDATVSDEELAAQAEAEAPPE